MEQLSGNYYDNLSFEQFFYPDDPATLSYLSSGSSTGESVDNIIYKPPVVDIDESGSSYPFSWTSEPKQPSPERPRVTKKGPEELDPDYDSRLAIDFARQKARYGPRPPTADVTIKLDMPPFPFGNEPELDNFDEDLEATVAATAAVPFVQPETRPPNDFVEAVMAAFHITETFPSRISPVSAVRAALVVSSTATRKHRIGEAVGILFPYMPKPSNDGIVGEEMFSGVTHKKITSRKSDAGVKRVLIESNTSVRATKRTSVTSVSNAKKARKSLETRVPAAKSTTFDLYVVSTRPSRVLRRMNKVLENLDVPDTPLNRKEAINQTFSDAILTAHADYCPMDSTVADDPPTKAAPSSSSQLSPAQDGDTSDSDSDNSDSSSDSGAEDSETVKKLKADVREESERLTKMLFTRWLHLGPGRNKLPTAERASSGHGSKDYIDVPSPEW